MPPKPERPATWPVVDKDWFLARMAELDFASQAALARAVELHLDGRKFDKSALHRILTGESWKVPPKTVSVLALVLKSSTSEILEKLGVPAAPHTKSVPVVGHVNDEGLIQRKKDAAAPAPANNVGGLVAIRNKDKNSLSFGWTYYFEERSGVAPDAVLKMCVVETTDRNEFLCFVLSSAREGKFTLKTVTGKPIGTVGLVSASPVRWSRA